MLLTTIQTDYSLSPDPKFFGVASMVCTKVLPLTIAYWNYDDHKSLIIWLKRWWVANLDW